MECVADFPVSFLLSQIRAARAFLTGGQKFDKPLYVGEIQPRFQVRTAPLNFSDVVLRNSIGNKRVL